MPYETKSKVIGDHEYSVTTLGALEGRKIYVQLMKTVAPGLKNAGSGKIDMGSIVANILSELDPSFIASVSDSFAKVTSVNLGEKSPSLSSIFDLHFAGKYKEFTEWFMFCIEVNFGSFLDVLGALQNAPSTSIPKPPIGSNSPNT